MEKVYYILSGEGEKGTWESHCVTERKAKSFALKDENSFYAKIFDQIIKVLQDNEFVKRGLKQ
jgi:hypothetical protein